MFNYSRELPLGFCYTLTFFSDNPRAFQVAFVAGDQKRFVERLARTLRLLSDAGDDVGGLLKRSPVGDGVHHNVAVDAELAPQVLLLQIDKTCQPPYLLHARIIPRARRRLPYINSNRRWTLQPFFAIQNHGNGNSSNGNESGIFCRWSIKFPSVFSSIYHHTKCGTCTFKYVT